MLERRELPPAAAILLFASVRKYCLAFNKAQHHIGFKRVTGRRGRNVKRNQDKMNGEKSGKQEEDNEAIMEINRKLNYRPVGEGKG